MNTEEFEYVKKKKYWDKRIVLVTEIFFTVISLLVFIFGLYINNSLVEGIASNCFTAFIVTVLFTIIDWNTETDTERALDSVERETKTRINEMQNATEELSSTLSNDLDKLNDSIAKFSSVVDLYSGKSCTFCQNSIKSVKFNRDDCNLSEFFNNAKKSISILATNLESFTYFLPIFARKEEEGVSVRVATIHPNFARSFNISNVVGYSGPEKRWSDMKKSLLKFLSFPEIEVKTYTTITPTIILMIVDDQCYVSYLLHGHRSRETPHFLFSNSDNTSLSPFVSFKKHFEGIWNDSGTTYADQEKILGLTYHSSKYRFAGWQFASSIYSKGITLCDLYDVLVRVWSKETCAPRMRSKWNALLPCIGQCTITAFLVQEIFGGIVFGIKLDDGTYHSYNVINECIFDLTSEQFPDNTFFYSKENEQSREYHFSFEEKKLRYEKLKALVENELSVL